MANNNASNVRVGTGKVGGYVFHAPLGTTPPTDSTTALEAAYEGLGYVSEDGVSRNVEVTTEDVLDWNGDVVRTTTTERNAEVTLAFLEWNEQVAKAVYGADNVTVTGDKIKVAFTGEQLPHEQWSVELADGDEDGRLWINDGQVTTPGGGELTFSRSAAVQHSITIKCFRDSDGKFFNLEMSGAADA